MLASYAMPADLPQKAMNAAAALEDDIKSAGDFWTSAGWKFRAVLWQVSYERPEFTVFAEFVDAKGKSWRLKSVEEAMSLIVNL